MTVREPVAWTEAVHRFPTIRRLLSRWLRQLADLRVSADDFAVIVENLEQSRNLNGVQRLESDLAYAAQSIDGLDAMLREKRDLPGDLHDANRVVLDKLAELHAATWLHRSGRRPVRFTKIPDLVFGGVEAETGVEVARLDQAKGRLANDSNKRWSYGPDIEVSIMGTGGRGQTVLSDQLYDRMKRKHPQLSRWSDERPGRRGAVWVAGGGIYFDTLEYEPYASMLRAQMPHLVQEAVRGAIAAVRQEQSLPKLHTLFFAADISTVTCWRVW